ncbi:MAG TPA: TadE family protein [Pilimelia sp.]|nr:TadE family protein [Pilimelia sp.]
MRRIPRRSHTGPDGGAAAVEMALVLPLLALVLFGIIDFGRMFHSQITLTEAAREGARAVAFGLDPADRISTTLGAAPTVAPEVTPCTGATDTDAVVRLREPFDPITPIEELIGGFAVEATGVMPCAG